MSKVEVDQVTQQSGTTLTVGGGACKTAVVDATTVTLGRCGGTVSLASGATQSGFGRTGTVDWITTPKVAGDSPVTAVSGKGYFLNTTAGEITLNLPAGSAGDIVSVADYARTWDDNQVTVAPNGTEKIGGGSGGDSANLATEGQSVTFVYTDSTQGWINIQDSTSAVKGAAFMVACVSGTGNTLTTAPDCANVKIAKFINPGSFTVSTAAANAADNLVSYMVVAGGGSGGNGSGNSGGGGGGGGFREVRSPTTPYTASPLDGYPSAPNRITVTATPYPICVGAGGTCGANGSNSTFSTITATGGGKGGAESGTTTSPTPGSNGGSGGGGTGEDASVTKGTGNTPPTSPAQGFDGGQGRCTGGDRAGGGGGGAIQAGTAGSSYRVAGPGGNGATTEITGSPVAYAGGGGGVGQGGGTGTGGTGGGGAGGNPTGTAGTINTGGGGGSGNSPTCGGAGLGGSGIVIIRYKFQ